MTFQRRWSVALAVAAAVVALTGAAHAGGPLGIGTPDSGGPGFGGPLGPFFIWISIHQQHFYHALSDALSALKEDPLGVWVLLGLSFAYGVFHAVGPGHGKAVITSYLVASGETVRRGILLSFGAAMVQAASAIIIVVTGAVVLRVGATAITFATDWVEIVSYGAIVLFGLWLLWSKTAGGGHHHHHHHHVPIGAAGHADHHDHNHADHHDEHDHDHDHRPARRGGAPSARSAIVAVGIRPCSGAIIVLVFALSQGLLAAGVAATLVMALGTGLTVASLAALAVLPAMRRSGSLTGSSRALPTYWCARWRSVARSAWSSSGWCCLAARSPVVFPPEGVSLPLVS